LDTLEDEYFKWEEHEFNKALMHRLFPETVNGDHRRFLSATNVIHHIRFSTGLNSQCLIIEHKDDIGDVVNEKVQFEDALINRIFQPRYFGDDARAIIDEIEGEELTDVDHPDRGNASLGRKKRSVKKRMTKRQMEQEAHRKFREYSKKANRRV